MKMIKTQDNGFFINDDNIPIGDIIDLIIWDIILEVMEDNLREFNLMHNRVAYTIALLMLCAVNSIVHFLMAWGLYNLARI